MSLGHIPGHKVRLQYLLPILIEKQVLGRQVHLRVCTAIIRPVMAGSCLGVNRFPDNALPCLQYPYQFLCFRCLVNPPSVESAYLHGLSVTGLKRTLLICGVISGRQVFHVIPCHIPVKGHAVPLSQKPLVDGAAIQDLAGTAKGIGHGHVHIPVPCIPGSHQRAVAGADAGLPVASQGLQVQFRCKGAHAFPCSCLDKLQIQFIAFCLRDNAVSLPAHIIGQVCIRGHHDIGCLEAVQGLKSFLQGRLIVCNHGLYIIGRSF